MLRPELSWWGKGEESGNLMAGCMAIYMTLSPRPSYTQHQNILPSFAISALVFKSHSVTMAKRHDEDQLRQVDCGVT